MFFGEMRKILSYKVIGHCIVKVYHIQFVYLSFNMFRLTENVSITDLC